MISCQKDNINEGNKINDDTVIIASGKISSPQWLISEVNKIAQKHLPSPDTGEYLYPWVYSVKYK